MANDAASGDKRWQTQAPASVHGAGRPAGRRTWFIVLAGLFLAFVSAAIVWVLLLRPAPPPPFFLAISISDYNARQYPVVPFARQDGERILRHFPAKKQAETKTKELLRRELDGLASRSEPLIVQIAALALVRDGKVYLLPGDADPDDESTWLEAREVVDAIVRSPAKHKLLILNLAHPIADARLGVLTDRVAETLEEQLSKDTPPFFVLCPCSAGQYSLTSEALQSSVLAYYLDQGLQGHADIDRDMRITVQELFAFVETRMDRWALLNRAMGQKPRLLGKCEDFVVASIGKEAPGELDIPKLEPYPDRLADGWKTRDLMRDKEAFRRAPRLLSRLDANLLRQDELTRGGAVQKKDVESLDDDIQRLVTDLNRALKPRHAPPQSLALARAQTGAQDDPALVDAVMNIVAAAPDTGGKAGVNVKLEEELVKKLQEQKGADFAQQAWCVVEALVRAPRLKPDHFRLAQNVLAGLKPTQRYAEVVHVGRLTDFADKLQTKDADSWPWPAEKVQGLLQALRAREAVIAALDREPGLLPWIAADFEAADVLRRSGEKKLLAEKPSSWPEAYQALQSARDKYQQALATLGTLRGCRWDLDRSFAELPAYMNLICAWPELDAQAEQAWSQAAAEAQWLQAFFGDPPAMGAVGKSDFVFKLDTHGQDLHRHLETLDKMLQRRIASAMKEDKAETAHLRLLESPLLKSSERAALLGMQRALAAKLHKLTDEQDQEDNKKGRIGAAQDGPRRPPDPNLGTVRARMSAALLRLGAFDARGNKLEPAGDGKASPRELARLESALHDAWAKDLLKQWQAAKTPALADALDRIVPPWELDRRTGTDKDPSRRLQKEQRDAFFQWLGERYQAEAGSADPQVSTFYLDAARELRLKATVPD
jgi:hypothetical protein